MIQTKLSWFERGRTDSIKPQSQSENPLTGDSDSKGKRTRLNPDEVAILDYVQQNGHVTKEELHHRSRLPESQLDGILESLEDKGLIEVSTGYTVVQIQSQNENTGSKKGDS